MLSAHSPMTALDSFLETSVYSMFPQHDFFKNNCFPLLGELASRICSHSPPSTNSPEGRFPGLSPAPCHSEQDHIPFFSAPTESALDSFGA